MSIELDVADFGAVADGATDSFAAIMSAFAAAEKGQTIRFHSGIYMVSQPLNPSAFLPLRLKGNRNIGVNTYPLGTIIKSINNTPVLRVLGNSETDCAAGLTCEDIQFHGNNHSEPITQFIFSKLNRFINCTWGPSLGAAIECVVLMDSQFHDCYFEHCGSPDWSTRAISLLNNNGSVAATNFNCNNLLFVGCRFENTCGVIKADQQGISTSHNRIRFIGCKFEMDGQGADFHPAAETFRFIGCMDVSFTDNFLAFGDIAAGAAPGFSLMYFSSVQSLSINNLIFESTGSHAAPYLSCFIKADMNSTGSIGPLSTALRTGTNATPINSVFEFDSSCLISTRDFYAQAFSDVPVFLLTRSPI